MVIQEVYRHPLEVFMGPGDELNLNLGSNYNNESFKFRVPETQYAREAVIYAVVDSLGDVEGYEVRLELANA